MRRARFLLSVLVLALASPVLAAPPKVPGPRVVAVGEVFEVEFEVDPAGPAVVLNPYKLDELFWREAMPSRTKTVAFIVQPKKAGNYRLTLWTKGDTVGDALPVTYYEFTAGGTPKPDDDKKDKKDDVIPPPKPVPVTSFRVLFVYESSDPLTPAMQRVMFGKTVTDYLDAKTTRENNWPGWRRYDKDVSAANESPVMKALWGAVQPKLSVVPCVVIEVNGKADILPFPADEVAALELFAKYAGGK